MTLATRVGKFVNEKYVQPALHRGDHVLSLRVSDVCRALNLVSRAELISGVLGSMAFRNTYHLRLHRTEGKGPMTTYTFDLSLAARARVSKLQFPQPST